MERCPNPQMDTEQFWPYVCVSDAGPALFCSRLHLRELPQSSLGIGAGARDGPQTQTWMRSSPSQPLRDFCESVRIKTAQIKL